MLTLALRLPGQFGELLRTRYGAVAAEYFDLRVAVIEELNFPSFSGQRYLHHNCAFPDGEQRIMGSRSFKLANELMKGRPAHALDLRPRS